MVIPSGSRLRRRMVATVLAVEIAAVVAVVVWGAISDRVSPERAAVDRTLVLELHLTGLALWGEASYCRQPTLAEPVAAHDAHPGAMDMLPAGSLVPAHPWAPTETAGAR